MLFLEFTTGELLLGSCRRSPDRDAVLRQSRRRAALLQQEFFAMIGYRNAPVASAVSTFSGQVLSYRPKDRQDDLLFLSDKANDSARMTQSGPVTISGEVDRIYTDVTGDLIIDDRSPGRKIVIAASGCSTAVVWNPWVEIAASMADLDDDDYRRMLCVETANAGPETVEIAAGGACRLTAEYTIR